MKKKLTWSVVVLAVVFGLLQFTNPARTNPPATSPFTNAPPQIAAILRTSCYDCHSDETRWPWYSHIAPISWQIASDVNDGRKHVDFSEWPYDKPSWAIRRLENMSDEIHDGDMPLSKYTLIHADARLSASQRKQLTDWLDAEAAQLKSVAAK